MVTNALVATDRRGKSSLATRVETGAAPLAELGLPNVEAKSYHECPCRLRHTLLFSNVRCCKPLNITETH